MTDRLIKQIGCVQHDCTECVARQQPKGPLISTALAEQQFGRYFRQGYDEGVRAQRTWLGLTDEDRLCAKYMQDAPDGIESVIDYIEAKLKEKNT